MGNKPPYRACVEFRIKKGGEELLPESLYGLAGQGFWIENKSNYSLFKCYPDDVKKFLKSLSSSGIAVYDIRVVKEPFKDYGQLTRKYFRPITVEGLTILPPWSKIKDPASSIVIEPGMAFGTGRHESTQIMIRLIKFVPVQNKIVLDVGCGSGILSLYASLCGARHTTGIDNDGDAITSARKNATLNHAKHIEYKCVDIKHVKGKYDIVLANLDIKTFTQYAKRLQHLVHKNGYLIISGILKRDHQKALSLFSPYVPLRTEEKNSWMGFIFQIDNHPCFG